MTKFLLNILLFSIIILVLLTFVLYTTNAGISRYHFSNSETESNTLVISKNSNYDIAILGISHARMFSRHRNHERLEKILNKKIINLGQGGGVSGINEQLFYLNYLYEKDNKVKEIIFVMSPPLMFSESLPLASNTFSEEKFDVQFFWSYVFAKGENKIERLTNYITSKLTLQWLNYRPYSKIAETAFLSGIDSNAIKEGYKLAYGESPLSYSRFNKSCIVLEDIIKLAKKQNTKITIIIPPALFKQWPGHQNCVDFSLTMNKKYGTSFYDFSGVIIEPKHYYDHHHLNTNGIVLFTNNYLKGTLK